MGASVGSTGGVGAARGSGWLVEEVGTRNRFVMFSARMDGHDTQGHCEFFSFLGTLSNLHPKYRYSRLLILAWLVSLPSIKFFPKS